MRLVLHIPHPLAPGLPRMMTLSFAAHATALLAIVLFPILGPRPSAPAWDDVLVGALIPDLPPGAAAGPAASAAPTEAPPSPPEPPPEPPPRAEPEPPPPPPEEPAKREPPRKERPPPVAPSPPKPAPVADARPTEAADSGGGVAPGEAAGGAAPAATGATAGSGAGGSTVGAAFDVGAFPFAYYRAVLETKLQAAWQRPMYPPGATEPIPVGVRFRIRRDGTVLDVAVEAPSPIPALDASALRAVYSAAPFPPLPAQFTADSLGVSIRFTLAP